VVVGPIYRGGGDIQFDLHGRYCYGDGARRRLAGVCWVGYDGFGLSEL
jgi:hypothetical protein